MWSLSNLLRHIVDTLWLNVLWLATCLTVVGAPAGTVAMLATLRRIQDGEEPAVARTYLAEARRAWRAASVIGWIWAVIGAVLVIDVLLLPHLGPAQPVMTVVVLVLGFVYVPMAALLACMVTREPEIGLRRAVRLAGSIAAARPAAGLQVLLAVVLGVVAIVIAPPALLVVPVLVAHSITLTWRLVVTPLTTPSVPHDAADRSV